MCIALLIYTCFNYTLMTNLSVIRKISNTYWVFRNIIKPKLLPRFRHLKFQQTTPNLYNFFSKRSWKHLFARCKFVLSKFYWKGIINLSYKKVESHILCKIFSNTQTWIDQVDNQIDLDADTTKSFIYSMSPHNFPFTKQYINNILLYLLLLIKLSLANRVWNDGYFAALSIFSWLKKKKGA